MIECDDDKENLRNEGVSDDLPEEEEEDDEEEEEEDEEEEEEEDDEEDDDDSMFTSKLFFVCIWKTSTFSLFVLAHIIQTHHTELWTNSTVTRKLLQSQFE